MAVRIPPQNLDSEKAFLGSILLRPDAINEIMDVINAEQARIEWMASLGFPAGHARSRGFT